LTIGTRSGAVVAADDPRQFVPDLNQFLRDSRKLGAEFQKELRNESVNVAKHVVQRSVQAASTAAEREVAKGLRAKSDRVPKIEMSKSQNFVSKSRRNAKRTEAAKAKRIDVFFGTEFGGGKFRKGNPTSRQTVQGGAVRSGGGYTSQFRPHRGKRGYFFYPTVRSEGPNIVRMYANGVERVRNQWSKGRL
jgi:hypothetical protein